MDEDGNVYVPFSQREGISDAPPQLKLGSVSKEFRRLIDYYLTLEVNRVSYSDYSDYSGSYFEDKWKRVAQDLHVLFFKRAIENYDNSTYAFQRYVRNFIAKSDIGGLFDFVEFLLRQSGCSVEFVNNLVATFIKGRVAYRVVDRKLIIAIGTEEQSEAYLGAIKLTGQQKAFGPRAHLINAGASLKNGRWDECVRESIHAVESVAVQMAPGASSLGKALVPIEKQGLMNKRLKSAIEKLYAYTNDENGVRHALVFEEAEAGVDETDALFMLGACASFVSYMLARRILINLDSKN